MNSHVSSGAPNADDETHSVVDLGKLQQYASMCLSRTCTQAEKLTHGRSYDIYVLHFAMDENHVALTIEEIQGELYRTRFSNDAAGCADVIRGGNHAIYQITYP